MRDAAGARASPLSPMTSAPLDVAALAVARLAVLASLGLPRRTRPMAPMLAVASGASVVARVLPAEREWAPQSRAAWLGAAEPWRQRRRTAGRTVELLATGPTTTGSRSAHRRRPTDACRVAAAGVA